VAKRPRPFNDAFSKLRELPAAEPPPPRPAPPPAAAEPPPPPREATADELWAGATAGIRRIEDAHGTIAPPRPRGAPDTFWHPDLEAVDALRALVSGDAPFDLSDGDEFFEGRVAGIDPTLVRNAGKRSVLVVHGRGLHSKDQLPVLKDALRTWLSTARFARHVLAFATARPADGGAGAVYVLLRRAGR